MEELRPFLPAVLIVVIFIVMQIRNRTPVKKIIWSTLIVMAVVSMLLWLIYGGA